MVVICWLLLRGNEWSRTVIKSWFLILSLRINTFSHCLENDSLFFLRLYLLLHLSPSLWITTWERSYSTNQLFPEVYDESTYCLQYQLTVAFSRTTQWEFQLRKSDFCKKKKKKKFKRSHLKYIYILDVHQTKFAG